MSPRIQRVNRFTKNAPRTYTQTGVTYKEHARKKKEDSQFCENIRKTKKGTTRRGLLHYENSVIDDAYLDVPVLIEEHVAQFQVPVYYLVPVQVAGRL